MRLTSITQRITDELERRDIEISSELVETILKMMFTLTKETTSHGESVVLENFCTFVPSFVGKRGYNQWRVHLRQAESWKRMCRMRKGKKDMMDKHGYEPQQDDPTAKTASEKGRCPVCGAETTGSPPVCPTHGSEPFERKDDGRKEEKELS